LEMRFKMLWRFKDRLVCYFYPFQIADPETCDRMYESLVRIHTNYYKTKYPRLRDTSFTGVTVEDCKMILAT
ncbi:PREDICTED: LOW QUALITY PROTEIN: ubiquinol-cytochrome-c reductase complex assembly factor 2, partial [Eurypyga helias]|uniref:LOW QUALITY PROTEIN: ubiquinol-cytochrome-c reductase complex assembly factor 2 n=1 Tax=Eurypyga helias TaxID=54383 RepID=UPI0005281E52